MRQIGTVSSEQAAETLVDYLLIQGIVAQTEIDDGKWVIWVREENQLESAQQILGEFREQPTDAKYTKAKTQAEKLRAESQRRARRGSSPQCGYA